MMMTARVPQIDWSKGFDRRWNGGNASATHAFNALSLLFPQGERFFIDIAREVFTGLGSQINLELENVVKAFIAQEAIHSHQHAQYNAVLRQQGFENVVHAYIDRLEKISHQHFLPLTNLAIVCAYEHYTAILGNYVLTHPRVLESAHSDLALIWGWHAAEETEHKAVCFDLYRAAGGGWLRRVGMFLQVTLNFHLLFMRLYFSLLWRDGCLQPASLMKTIGQSSKFFFGRSGIAWHVFGYGLRYLSPRFHPWDQDNRSILQAWLSVNKTRLR